MADISLRDYLSKLDTLLNRNAPSEVIHHCRHILQYFPKNADTYRYLGRALVQSSSWEEAGEVFQRVLSVYPDDYTAHVGLSDVYLHLKRPDDAIWHLERAFDQNPNNQSVIDGLRELYRRYRRVEQAKIQLTAGAVARQYIRNSLYEQAIDTLRQALERWPERADLRLLLAQTYHEGGYKVEAAEVALEVLKVLPDCLEANRILTELWLSESRPSDAQRYLNRIQSVDPYIALELAQGQAVPNDAFRLEELDYRRAAEREILTSSPDWLRDLGSTGEPAAASTSPASTDDAAWMESFAPSKSADEEDLPVFDEAFSTDLPDDWLTDLPEISAEPVVPPADSNLPPPQRKPGMTGLLDRINQPETPSQAEPEPDLDSLFSTEATVDELFPADEGVVSQTEESLPDLPDLFAEQSPSIAEPEASAPPIRQAGALKDSDPLAWLHESGIETVDNPEQPASDDLFGAEDDNLALQDADAANPLAWLQGYGGDMINEDAQSAREQNIPTSEDDADPLAWLQSSGVEVVEEAPAPSPAPPQEVDPLDWLADESLLDEALSLEALIDSPASPSPTVPASSEVIDRQEAMADEQDDALDWFTSPDTQPEAGALGLASEETPRAEPQPDNESVPDWFAEMNDEEPVAEPASEAPDWLSEMSPADEPEPEQPASAGMLNWLSQDSSASQAEQDTTPASSNEGGFEWMAASDSEEVPTPEASSEAPAWMSQLPPAEEPEYEPETPAASGADDSGFEWMADANTAEQPPAEVSAETPDWLSQIPAADEPVSEPQVTADNGGFEWMAEIPSEEQPTAEPTLEVPDWLSQTSPSNTPEPEPVAAADESGFEWMATASDEAEPPVDEPATEVPDWMSQLPAAEEAELEPEAPIASSVDDRGFEWMTEAAAEELPASEPTSETPDWLSQIPAADEPVSEPQVTADDGGFEWMAEIPSEEQPAAEPTPEVPEWLSQLPAAEEAEPESEMAANESGFEWMAEVGDEDKQTVAEADADEPEWLAQAKPVVAQTADLEEPEPSYSWEDNDNEASEEPSGAEAAPDWLSNIQSAQSSAVDEPVDEPTGGEFSWIQDITPEPVAATEASEPAYDFSDEHNESVSNGIGDEEVFDEEVAAAPTPASNAPDWLNAMVPGLDVDYDAPEDEQIEESFVETPAESQAARTEKIAPIQNKREFDWLLNIVEEETQQVRAIQDSGKRRRFVFSRPPVWLRQPTELRDKPGSTTPVVDEDDFDDVDLPPWLQ